MKYKEIVKGIFVSRPNRFIANVEVDGNIVVCHVKNTGRCRELLTGGATVILEINDAPTRKTKYDLIAVYKENVLVNIDSQAPNKLFAEWIIGSGIFEDITFIKAETTYENSRFDFYIETKDRKIFAEVKGVTLEENGIAMFPDAPTLRGIKHLQELVHARKNGYESYIFFVIQMKGCNKFVPNSITHPKFALELAIAKNNGVNVVAVSCEVFEDNLHIDGFVPTEI